MKAGKSRRNLKLAELEIRDRGPSTILLTVMGEAWTQLGDSRQADECFRRALTLARRGSTEMLEAYYGLLSSYDSQPDAADQQVQACIEAIEIFPLDAQLLCAMGCYMQRSGRLDLAARAYRSAVQHGQLNIETWHVAAIRDVAAACLSLSLELLGEEAEAVASTRGIVGRRPRRSLRLQRRLLDSLRGQHDRRKEATLDQVARLPADTPHRDALRSAVRGACLAAQKNWTAARAYLQTAYDAGCRDVLCLRWLSVALLSLDEVAAAEPILRLWQIAAPGTIEVQKYLEAIAADRQQRPVEKIAANNSTASQPANRHFRIDAPAINSTPNLFPAVEPNRVK